MKNKSKEKTKRLIQLIDELHIIVHKAEEKNSNLDFDFFKTPLRPFLSDWKIDKALLRAEQFFGQIKNFDDYLDIILFRRKIIEDTYLFIFYITMLIIIPIISLYFLVNNPYYKHVIEFWFSFFNVFLSNLKDLSQSSILLVFYSYFFVSFHFSILSLFLINSNIFLTILKIFITTLEYLNYKKTHENIKYLNFYSTSSSLSHVLILNIFSKTFILNIINCFLWATVSALYLIRHINIDPANIFPK